MPIAPRTYRAWASRPPSKRALRDAAITEILAGIYEPDEHGRRDHERHSAGEHPQKPSTTFYDRPNSKVLRRPVEPGQYTALKFGETLYLEGLLPSIGSVGDAYDNALAESTIGIYKTECIRDDSPFRTGPLDTLADIEHITAAWVHWYNTARLMHRLGRRPPAEAEAEYHAHVRHGRPADHT